MANLHAELMTAKAVHDIALPILEKTLAPFGFQHVTVNEEEDFDGDHIFRMTAHVQTKVPANKLIDTLEAIHRALRSKGEERFVYLSTERPGEVENDEDVE
jgi:hypothetical protein